jgi:hypothetical protein
MNIKSTIQLARATQQDQQVRAILKQRESPPGIVATRPRRSGVDGSFSLIAGDGGTIRQGYISSSTPANTPPVVVPSRTIGLPGYFTQRPS